MARNIHDDSISPVSFRVNVARLPQKGMPVRLVADEKQRAALAEAHDLESVSAYVADMTVSNWKRNGVRISGVVKAQITQNCVVTLEPIEASINEPFDALFLPERSKLGRQGFETGGEIVLNAEGDDAPETFSGDHIDIGGLSEEFFGLAIDPYPRKPGIEVDNVEPVEEAAKPAEDWKARLSAFKSQK